MTISVQFIFTLATLLLGVVVLWDDLFTDDDDDDLPGGGKLVPVYVRERG